MSADRDDARQAGFTLIEVVVALAVMAVLVGAISALSASNRMAAGATAERIRNAFAARVAATELDARANLAGGAQLGRSEGVAWSYNLRPVAGDDEERRPLRWTPYHVAIDVMGPGGARTRVHTIRLHRAEP